MKISSKLSSDATTGVVNCITWDCKLDNDQLPAPSAHEIKHSSQWLQAFVQQLLDSANIDFNIFVSLLNSDQKAKLPAMSFADYMDLAMNHPQFGYYRSCQPFGERTDSNESSSEKDNAPQGDFTTAPTFSPLYSRCLARAFAEVLDKLSAEGDDKSLEKNNSNSGILEIGPGNGAFAEHCLAELSDLNSLPARYVLLEPSAALRAIQQQRLQPLAEKYSIDISWVDAWPSDQLSNWQGVIVANEVCDVLPVERFRVAENGIEMMMVRPELSDNLEGAKDSESQKDAISLSLTSFWAPATPEVERAVKDIMREEDLHVGYESEICLSLPAWIRSACDSLQRGVLLVADYGCLRPIYYHSQRDMGTLMCHYRHRAHADPFFLPGGQDVTAWVDFSVVGEAAEAAGADVLDYATQAEALINLGIADFMQPAAELYDADDAEQNQEIIIQQQQIAQQIKYLTSPNLMGENFKIMLIGKN